MSPKKAILQALEGATELHPSSLPGYAERPGPYQEAVNELLRDRLVEGRKDAEGRIMLALNQHRRRDVERMLRPLWARPTVWAVLALLLALGTGLVAG